jgi:hypothetical protein
MRLPPSDSNTDDKSPPLQDAGGRACHEKNNGPRGRIFALSLSLSLSASLTIAKSRARHPPGSDVAAEKKVVRRRAAKGLNLFGPCTSLWLSRAAVGAVAVAGCLCLFCPVSATKSKTALLISLHARRYRSVEPLKEAPGHIQEKVTHLTHARALNKERGTHTNTKRWNAKGRRTAPRTEKSGRGSNAPVPARPRRTWSSTAWGSAARRVPLDRPAHRDS